MTSDHLLDKQPDFQSSVFLSSISSPPIVLRAHYYLGGISFYHHLPLFASSRLFCYLFFTFFPFPSTLFSSLFFIFPSSQLCTLSSFRAFHLFFSRSSSPLLVYFFLSLFFPLSFHLLCPLFVFFPFLLLLNLPTLPIFFFPLCLFLPSFRFFSFACFFLLLVLMVSPLISFPVSSLLYSPCFSVFVFYITFHFPHFLSYSELLLSNFAALSAPFLFSFLL